MMDSDTIGLNTFIEPEDGRRYVTLNDTSNNRTRIGLAKAIVKQKSIVCRGTNLLRPK